MINNKLDAQRLQDFTSRGRQGKQLFPKASGRLSGAIDQGNVYKPYPKPQPLAMTAKTDATGV